MKMRILVSSAMVSLVLAGPGSNECGAAVEREHAIMIPGTVVSSDSRTLIIRTDDHGHRMPFDVGPASSVPDRLPKGAHVSVTYHPLGPTGQAAVEVRVIERNADTRSQASFRTVTGPVDTRVSAR
jgi:hypothetical protein